MRIRVWNAFASNNSGSYTIVGRFESADRAGEVARELAEVIAAQTAWHEVHAYEASDASPIANFARQRGLATPASDWPDYGAPPAVIAVDHQVIVHAPYTVTLPRTFGELFYARGGVVDVTLDHAHDALVVHVEAYWPWSLGEEERAARAAALEAAVMDPASPVRAHVAEGRLACGRPRDWMEAPLLVGAVFADLVEGVRAVTALVTAHEGTYRVAIHEALDRADPLSHLRARP